MKSRFTLTSFVLSIVLSSCSMYHPQAVDIPLISEKGELRADASFSVAATVLPQTPGINGTVSYGVTNWLAVQGFANYDFNDSYYFQGAIGAYKPFNKFVIEGFAGVGHGYSFHDYSYSTQNRLNEISGNYNIYYGQLDFGWKDLDFAHLDVGGAVKVGSFNPNFSSIDYDSERTIMSEVKYDTPLLLFEPQLIVRLGGERLKFSLKLAYSLLETINPTTDSSIDFQYEPFDIGIGINYRF